VSNYSVVKIARHCERNQVERGNLSLVVRIAGLLTQHAGKIAALHFCFIRRMLRSQ